MSAERWVELSVESAWAQVKLAASYVAEWPVDLNSENITQVLERALSDLRVAQLQLMRETGMVDVAMWSGLAQRIASVRQQAEVAPWQYAPPEHLATTDEEAQRIKKARMEAQRGPQETPRHPGPSERKEVAYDVTGQAMADPDDQMEYLGS